MRSPLHVLLSLVAALGIVACGTDSSPAPLEPAAVQEQPAPSDSGPAVLTFEPGAEVVRPAPASARIDASEPREDEVEVHVEERDFLVRVRFPDETSLDEQVDLEYGVSRYEPREDGSTRLMQGELAGVISVGREGRQTDLGFARVTVQVVLPPGEAADPTPEDPPRLWVRVTTPGWQQRTWWSPRSSEEELSDELYQDLDRHGLEPDWTRLVQARLRRGTTISGVVLDPEGAPVDSGRVWLRRENNQGRLRRETRTEIDEDGRFRLHVYREGTYEVLATVTGIGLARVEELELAPDSEPLKLTLQLAGPGKIEGVVRDQHGLPVPGFPIEVQRKSDLRELPAAEPVDGEPGEVAGDPVPQIDQSTGMSTAEVVTDRQGRFVATGLRPGTYTIYERDLRDRRKRLEEGVQTTREEPIELTVTAVRVLVSCYEPTGEAVAWRPRGTNLPRPRPRTDEYGREVPSEAAEREVLTTHVRAPIGGSEGRWTWRATEEAHTWALWSQTGKEYRILIGSKDRQLVERQVMVNPGQDRIEVTVTLAPRIESAVLRVQVTDPPDTPDSNGHTVKVLALESQTTVGTRSATEPGKTLTFELAPGSYRVTATPNSDRRWAYEEKAAPRPLEVVQVVDLAPGVEVDLGLETNPAGGAEVHCKLPPLDHVTYGPDVHDGGEIRVEGVGPDGEQVSTMIQTWAGWYYQQNGGPRDLTAEGTVAGLVPGAWSLTFSVTRCEPVTRAVEISNGTWSPVHLELELAPAAEQAGETTDDE